VKSPVAKLAMTGGRITVPLVITGTVQAPTYSLDAKAVGAKVQEQVTEKAKEAVDELLRGKKPRDVLKEGEQSLKQLFGR